MIETQIQSVSKQMILHTLYVGIVRDITYKQKEA